jgi:hypothetical protein
VPTAVPISVALAVLATVHAPAAFARPRGKEALLACSGGAAQPSPHGPQKSPAAGPAAAARPGFLRGLVPGRKPGAGADPTEPLRYGSHVKASRWQLLSGGVDGARGRGPGAAGNGAPLGSTTGDVEQALRLKLLLGERGLTDPRRGFDREAVDAALERELDAHRVYATDLTGGRDRRVLRPAAELAHEADLLLDRLRRTAGELGADAAREVEAQVREALAQLGGRDVYTRPGADGLVDLLADAHLAARRVGERVGRSPAGRRLQSGAAVTPRLERRLRRSEVTELARQESARVVLGALARGAATHAIDGTRPHTLPLELRHALTIDPAIGPLLADLTRRHIPLHLQKLGVTPPEVLHAISLIAVASQENLITTWLPRLVSSQGAQRPKLVPTELGQQRASRMGLLEPGEIATQERLEAAADTITRSIDEFVQVVVAPNAAGVDSHAPEIERINRALGPARRLWAGRRMVFDNADERSHTAQEIIKKMMWVGPIAHGLELLNLGPAAKLFAGSADDVGGWYAEYRLLLETGFDKGMLLRQARRVQLPVFVGAGVASFTVESLLRSGHDLQAGALFGASAVALSLTTSIQSIRFYKEAYDALLAAGKIEGKVGPLMNDAAFQARLRAFERGLDDARGLLEPARRQELLGMVRQALGQQQLPPAEVEAIVGELARLDFAAVAGRVRRPGSLARWKQAVIQDFSNPARLGILLGSIAAPVAGMVAAKLGGMHNGFVMAAIGSTETVIAGATVMAAGALDNWRYRHALRVDIARARRKTARGG